MIRLTSLTPLFVPSTLSSLPDGLANVEDVSEHVRFRAFRFGLA